MNQFGISSEGPISIDEITNRLHVGHAAQVMKNWPENSVDIVITSPPYWTAVSYEDQAETWPTYEEYLSDMLSVWAECARVLRPNGKLCINSPVMPIPKNVINQHTRHIKNIAFDIDHSIIEKTILERYSVFIWQKQTSKLMFGRYPFPGNLLENNTVEFISVYVKPGKPPKFDPELKEANRISRSEWVDLIQQIWFMYPEDVKREAGHPAPFPSKLPARLLRLYSYGAYRDFEGEVVLDPFVGTGTTCVTAKRMGRRWVGIDISETYLRFAKENIDAAPPFEPMLIVGRAKYPTKEELVSLLAEESGTSGAAAFPKHKNQIMAEAFL